MQEALLTGCRLMYNAHVLFSTDVIFCYDARCFTRLMYTYAVCACTRPFTACSISLSLLPFKLSDFSFPNSAVLVSRTLSRRQEFKHTVSRVNPWFGIQRLPHHDRCMWVVLFHRRICSRQERPKPQNTAKHQLSFAIGDIKLIVGGDDEVHTAWQRYAPKSDRKGTALP